MLFLSRIIIVSRDLSRHNSTFKSNVLQPPGIHRLLEEVGQLLERVCVMDCSISQYLGGDRLDLSADNTGFERTARARTIFRRWPRLEEGLVGRVDFRSVGQYYQCIPNITLVVTGE